MKVDFNVDLIDFDGTKIKETKTTFVDGKPHTDYTGETVKLQDAIVRALAGQYRDDETLDPVKKLERYALGIELKKKGATEVIPEDLVLIKEYAAKGCTILAHGRICDLIDSIKVNNV